MPILVQCGSCKKQFQAGDHLAGKRVKCPGCQTPLVIPGAQAAPQQSQAASGGALDDLFDGEVPVHHAPYGQAEEKCPGCGRPIQPDTVLCVDCGYDFRKGRQVVPDTPAQRQTRLEARERRMRGEAPGAKKKNKET